MKIVIDAGHGKDTAGKRAPGDVMREYHFNSVVAQHVKNILASYENTEVIFVHDDARDVPLSERVKIANNSKADVYVSIHANAHGDGRSFTSANGIETYVYKKTLGNAVKLATEVQNRLVKLRGQTNRGVKEGNFQVLRETKMTAILIECGFMTNEKGLAYLMDNQYRIDVAYAIVDSLAVVYGLKKKPEPKPAPQPAPQPVTPKGTIYRVQLGAFSNRDNAERLIKELESKGYKAVISIGQL